MITTKTPRWFKASTVACAVGISGFALFAGSASAGEKVCPLSDLNPVSKRDTGWSVRFDDTQVIACDFKGNAGTGRNKGTLSLTLAIKDGKPIPIQFVESAAEVGALSSFGLRITWNITLKNQFQTLKGIRGKAVDKNPVLEDDQNQFVEDDHPGFAHFHQELATAKFPFNAGPFSTAEGCDCESEPDFKVRGGTLASSAAGTFGTVQGIGVHQIEQKDATRNFTVQVRPLLQK